MLNRSDLGSKRFRMLQNELHRTNQAFSKAKFISGGGFKGLARNFVGEMGAMSGSLGQFTAMLGPMGLAAAGAAVILGKLTLAASKLGAELESQTVSISTMIKKTDESMLDAEIRTESLLDSLDKLANRTPLENQDIVEGTKRLIAFGLEADMIANKLMPQMADVAAGAQIPVAELSSIFGKAFAGGRLQAMELNQMTDRGIPIMDALGKVTKKSAAEIRKMGEQGKLSREIMLAAFDEMTGRRGKVQGHGEAPESNFQRFTFYDLRRDEIHRRRFWAHGKRDRETVSQTGGP